MRCSIPNCRSENETKETASSQGITFHKFPKDPYICKAWVDALCVGNWKPRDISLICSEHFQERDFYVTKDGLRTLHMEVIPRKICDPEEPAVLRVCRICLSIDDRMYDIRKFEQTFEQITGLPTCDDASAQMPQRLCWECAARLKAAGSLRTKALLSDRLLQDLLKPDTCLTICDLKTINRTTYGLKSNLKQLVLDSGRNSFKIQDTFVDTSNNHDQFTQNNLDTRQTSEKCEDHDFDVDEKSHLHIKTEVKKVSEMSHVDLVEVEHKDLGVTKIYEDGQNTYIEEYNSTDNEALDREIVDIKSEIDIKNESKELEEPVASKKQKIITGISRTETFETEQEAKSSSKSKEKRRTNLQVDTSLFNITPLSHDEQIEEFQQRKKSMHYKKAAYKCNVCYTGFQVQDRYSAHLVKHTEQFGAFECFICKARKQTERYLHRHMIQYHSQQYSCRKCDLVTRHRNVAIAHGDFHEGKTYKCPHCHREFSKKTTMLNHVRLKHISDSVCAFCGYTFISEKGLKAHKSRKHPLVYKTLPSDGPYCEECNIYFASNEAYKIHLRLSSKHLQNDGDPSRIRNEYRPMIDQNCPPLRRAERRPAAEIQQDNKNSPVECEQCGTSLPNFVKYVRHFERIHPGVTRTQYPTYITPYMCEQCGRICHSLENLECHKWVHTGKKKYQCDHCKKFFTTKLILGYHMHTHGTTKRQFACRHCGKTFYSGSNLKTHEFLHTGKKPYQCGDCEKSFPTADGLRQHRDHVHYKIPWPKKAKKNHTIMKIERI